MIRLHFFECPITDIIGAIVDAVGDSAALDAGVGAAADAGAGVAAADVGAGALAADAGADIGAGALAADAGTSAALGGIADTGIADAGVGTLGDVGFTGAGTGALADTGTAALGADSALGGAGADTAALGSGGAIPGAVGDAGAGAMLPEQTVLGQAAGPAAAGTSSLPDALGGMVLPSAVAAGAPGAGGSGVPGASAQPADFSGSLASTTPTQFLSADDTAPSLQSLDPSTMQALGIDPTGGLNDPGGAGGDFDLSNAAVNPSDTGIDPNAPAPGAGQGGGIGSWLSNPKNAATAGLLGLSLKNALTTPKLPGADATASAAAQQAVKGATSVVQSGGTATPEWGSQKASIDATINQQIQQQTEAIMQAAASSGEGNQNSGIVQQQIAQMTQNANVQRQNLYAQAQQQNVSNALSELSGGDQVLTSIGNTQLQQSEEAQALAAQTAEMALLLQSGGSMRIPGSTGIPGGP